MSAYIEKEAAIRNICKGCGLFDTDNCICMGSVRCDEYDAVRDTPSASVAPIVRGEWIKLAEDLYRCSHCCVELEIPDIYIKSFHFCPNCGAAMSEEAVRKLKERSGSC